MLKKTIFSFLLLLIILPVSVLGSSFDAGAVFMMIFPGSRATAMGGAFTASEGDIFSTYYNDAALAFKDGKMIGLQHANWLPGLFPGMYYEYLSMLFPMGEDLNLSFAVTYLTTGKTEVADTAPGGTGYKRKWSTYDIALKGAGSLQLADNLGVGIGMKYIHSFLAPPDVLEWLSSITGTSVSGGSGSAWALDLSLLYVWNDFINSGMGWFKTLRAGAALQNLGPEINYVENGESDPLPRTLRLGLSLGLLEEEAHKLNLNLDLIRILIDVEYTDFKDMWNDSWKTGGVEYILNNLFSLRLGYFHDDAGERSGPTFGAGLQYEKFVFDLSVDQEIYDFPTSNYRISAQFSF